MILIDALYRLHQILESTTLNICPRGRGHVIAGVAQRQVIVVHVVVEVPYSLSTQRNAFSA